LLVASTHITHCRVVKRLSSVHLFTLSGVSYTVSCFRHPVSTCCGTSLQHWHTDHLSQQQLMTQCFWHLCPVSTP